MAEDTPSSDFYWDNVVFKVRDRLWAPIDHHLCHATELRPG